MKKIAIRVLALSFGLAALASSAPRAEAAGHACNLFCIIGYHCCLHGNQATCVPESEAC
jgi:hypothetical protein